MAPAMNVPQLGHLTPSRGNWISRIFGRVGLRAIGWRFEGEIPNVAKAVVIAAPHTTNWDFIIGVLGMFAVGVRVSFLGKDTLFRPPLGWVMRWLGGFPVNRVLASGVVEQTVELIQRSKALILALSPEGTRSRVERWRTGFYHIAEGAGVPIIPVAFDFGTRSLRFGEPLIPSGDMRADLERLVAFFSKARAYRPELASLTPL